MRAVLLGVAAGAFTMTACTTSHVDSPTVVTPPSVSITSTAGVPSGLPAPCSVLTAAAVKKAVGGTVADGVTPSTAGRPECDWAVTGSALGTGKVIVYYPAAQTKAAFDTAEAGVPGATKVVELGDAAFYTPGVGALTVLAGEHQFVTQGVFHPAPADAKLQPALIAIAGTVETHF